MQTNRRTGVLLRKGVLGCLIVFASCLVAEAQVNRSLKILYAGRPGSEREEDFIAFLRQNFDTVGTGNLQTFQEADTQGFDVTLLDWDWNDLRGPRPQVSEDFSRPIITLGVQGGLICRQWRVKPDYL